MHDIAEFVSRHPFLVIAAAMLLVMLVVLIFIITNFVVDLFYSWLDPRIRYS